MIIRQQLIFRFVAHFRPEAGDHEFGSCSEFVGIHKIIYATNQEAQPR